MKIRRALKGFPLFNVEQCADLPTETVEDLSCSQSHLAKMKAYQAVDALLATHSVEVRFGGNYAFYDRHCDFIGMPEKAANDAGEEYYYSTLLHELTHWTGHPTRLNRPGIAARIYSPKLEAVEELIAEIGSAFLCAEFGIRNHLCHEGAYSQMDPRIGRRSKGDIQGLLSCVESALLSAQKRRVKTRATQLRSSFYIWETTDQLVPVIPAAVLAGKTVQNLPLVRHIAHHENRNRENTRWRTRSRDYRDRDRTCGRPDSACSLHTAVCDCRSWPARSACSAHRD